MTRHLNRVHPEEAPKKKKKSIKNKKKKEKKSEAVIAKIPDSPYKIIVTTQSSVIHICIAPIQYYLVNIYMIFHLK